MDTTSLNDQQLHDYAANYLVLRLVACNPEQDERLQAAMELACNQVKAEPVPTHAQFDLLMAAVRAILAAAEGG